MNLASSSTPALLVQRGTRALFASASATLARHWPTLLALALGSAASLALLFLRYAATGRVGYAFLIWNLFLAWVPLCFALLACHTRWPLPLRLVCAAAWLAFVPNAFYIVTDLMHLRERPPVPLWWDILCVQSFVWNGLLLGFVSLYWIQAGIERRHGCWTGWIAAALVLALSGLGVYLGRELRWNSWEVLERPLHLFGQLVDMARHPTRDRNAVLFPIAFGAFYGVCYVMLWVLSGLRERPRRARRAGLDSARGAD
jgi:uncharacterized membrane protein